MGTAEKDCDCANFIPPKVELDSELGWLATVSALDLLLRFALTTRLDLVFASSTPFPSAHQSTVPSSTPNYRNAGVSLTIESFWNPRAWRNPPQHDLNRNRGDVREIPCGAARKRYVSVEQQS
jgi:hypothetical protein